MLDSLPEKNTPLILQPKILYLEREGVRERERGRELTHTHTHTHTLKWVSLLEK